MIGLMGVGNDGRTLYAPSGKRLCRVPFSCVARFVQRWQHRIAALSWRFGLLVLLALFVPGCCCPSKEARDQISTAAAVTAANLREWGDLTDAQQKQAHQAAAQAFHDLDWSVNGNEPPPEFAPKPAAEEPR